jgi:hypothetical protein
MTIPVDFVAYASDEGDTVVWLRIECHEAYAALEIFDRLSNMEMGEMFSLTKRGPHSGTPPGSIKVTHL